MRSDARANRVRTPVRVRREDWSPRRMRRLESLRPYEDGDRQDGRDARAVAVTDRETAMRALEHESLPGRAEGPRSCQCLVDTEPSQLSSERSRLAPIRSCPQSRP